MSKERHDRREFEQAVEAYRRGTGVRASDAARLRVVREHLLADLGDQRRPVATWWRTLALAGGGLGAGVAAAAAVVVLVLQPRLGPPPTSPLQVAAGPAAELLLRSGEVAILDDSAAPSQDANRHEIAAGSDLILASNASLVFRVGPGDTAAAVGPARLRYDPEGHTTIRGGRVAFAFGKRPRGQPEILQAGSARIYVVGTRFAIAVEDQQLLRADVAEGEIQLRWPHEPARPTETVAAGETWSASETPPDVSAVTDLIDRIASAPHLHADQQGYALVRTEPEHAEVRYRDLLLGETPLLARLPVGAQELLVSLEGYASLTQTLEVPATGTVEVEISLTPAGDAPEAEPAVAPAVAETPESEPAERRVHNKDRRRSVAELWQVAQGALEARDCSQLEGRVRELLGRVRSSDDKARAEMMDAECQLHRGEKSKALEVLNRITWQYPDSPTAEPALFEAAKIESDLGRRNTALLKLRRYLSRYPKGAFAAAATFRQCEILVSMKQVNEAQRCLDGYVKDYPSERRFAEAVLILATMARNDRQWDRAAALYGRYLATNPKPKHAEEALYHRIICLRRGNLGGVSAAVQEYLRRFPDGPHAAEVRQ